MSNFRPGKVIDGIIKTVFKRTGAKLRKLFRVALLVRFRVKDKRLGTAKFLRSVSSNVYEYQPQYQNFIFGGILEFLLKNKNIWQQKFPAQGQNYAFCLFD